MKSNAVKLNKIMQKIEHTTIVESIRTGLVNMIPIVLIGAFALVFKTFPINAYQSFIKSFANGILLDVFSVIFSATFGLLSVYITIFISKAYLSIKGEHDIPLTGAAAAALLAFFILAIPCKELQVTLKKRALTQTGVKGEAKIYENEKASQ